MKQKSRKAILLFGDIIFCWLSFCVTLYLGFWQNLDYFILYQHLLPFSILYVMWLAIFYICGLYDLEIANPKAHLFSRLSLCLAVCLAIGALFFYAIPLFGITPKTNLLINILVFGILILLWREIFYWLFSSFFQKRVGVLGQNKWSLQLGREMQKCPQFGFRFIKFLSQAQPIPFQAQKSKLNTLVISQNIAGQKNLVSQLYKCLNLKINFLDLSSAFEIIFQKIPADFIDQQWFLNNLAEGEKTAYDKVKRIADIFFPLLIIAITSPLWAIIALIISQTDKGKIFYKQKRAGKEGKNFWLYKFRTMKEDAEKHGPEWAQKNDARATKVGKILRKIHLDELPQMLNVLSGDISLVGPRPERPEFVRQLERAIPHYQLRHIIKPGFTGWAQIKFRYARTTMDSQEKFQYDLYYLKNRSFLLDLGILLKTFQILFRGE